MIIFLQASRSLAEPHSSASVQFVTALMSSSQRARGLPLFLVPPPIPSIIDFSKLFSLRMICPKYDSCCFFINVSNGLVALISSITDLLVHYHPGPNIIIVYCKHIMHARTRVRTHPRERVPTTPHTHTPPSPYRYSMGLCQPTVKARSAGDNSRSLAIEINTGGPVSPMF